MAPHSWHCQRSLVRSLAALFVSSLGLRHKLSTRCLWDVTDGDWLRAWRESLVVEEEVRLHVA